jgi:hypothetical protein
MSAGLEVEVCGSNAEVGGSAAEVCGSDAEVGGSDAEVGGSDAEVEGSEVVVGMSNAEVVVETRLFSPLEVGVSTLSGSLSVVDSSSSLSSSCFSETSISAGKGELDVASPDFVTIVL